MIDISASGASLRVMSLKSFPFGFKVSEFADDIDPLDIEPTEANGYEPLIDGSLFYFGKTAIVKVNVGVIAGSADDINLKILLQASKGDTGFIPLPDETLMIISYPNNGSTTFSGGSIINGPMGDSVAASGRLKGNKYTFVFSQITRLNSTKDIVATGLSALQGLF